MKVLGIAAVAALVALVVGFGGRFGSTTPTAQADETDVTVIGCEFLVNAIDGAPLDVISGADVAAACGLAPLPPTAAADTASVQNLAKAIGNKDGKLQKSDFADSEGWDDNQVADACTAATLFCTLDVFVFVNDEKPVALDLQSGLASAQAASLDFTCNTDGVTLTTDNDCSDGSETVPLGTANNGDGVVLFNVFNGNASPGDVKSVTVSQESVEESFDVNVVGVANDVKLTLVESTIGTSGSTTNREACETDVDVTDAISPSNATLAYAQAFDADDTILARIPVTITIPPGDVDDVASLGVGNPAEAIVGDTSVTLKPQTTDAPIAFYQVICGGKGTGDTTITATIDDAGSTIVVIGPSTDNSTADLTVVGAPSAIAATVSPAQIACDGTETATVTATITDADGNNVADGTEVNFSVVALGTANPINTTTTGGKATTTITPLSNASAGVTVVITAGDAEIATPVQTSTRVDCALPIAVSPTAAAPTARPGISGPDTGTGGYLGQDSTSGFPMWTLVALAAASLTLVAGGMAVRRSR